MLGANLLSAPDALSQFTRQVDGDFQQQEGVDISLTAGALGGALGGAAAGPSRTLVFPQDRITLNLTAARSSISRDYPSIERLDADLGKLAEIATLAINVSRTMSGNSLQAYGYNMQVVFRLNREGRSIEYLGERLFSGNIARASGKTLVGGTASLILREGATQWTFAAIPWPHGDLERRQSGTVGQSTHGEPRTNFPSSDRHCSRTLGDLGRGVTPLWLFWTPTVEERVTSVLPTSVLTGTRSEAEGENISGITIRVEAFWAGNPTSNTIYYVSEPGEFLVFWSRRRAWIT